VTGAACRLALFALLLGASCLLATASEAGQPADLASVDPMDIPADDRSISVIDSDVVDEDGDSLGQITALILSPSNQPMFAILSVGAILGVTQKFVIVRASALKRADGKTILVGGTRASLAALPSYARAE